MWKYHTDPTGGMYSSAAVGRSGTLFIGTPMGSVLALNPTTGALVWSYAIGSPIVSSPSVSAAGVVYIGKPGELTITRRLSSFRTRATMTKL